MQINSVIVEPSNYHRAMNGYKFIEHAHIELDAMRRAYSDCNSIELENRIARIADDLYDGWEGIYDTDNGLCSVMIHWETKEPLCWCRVEKE